MNNVPSACVVDVGGKRQSNYPRVSYGEEEKGVFIRLAQPLAQICGLTVIGCNITPYHQHAQLILRNDAHTTKETLEDSIRRFEFLLDNNTILQKHHGDLIANANIKYVNQWIEKVGIPKEKIWVYFRAQVRGKTHEECVKECNEKREVNEIIETNFVPKFVPESDMPGDGWDFAM